VLEDILCLKQKKGVERAIDGKGFLLFASGWAKPSMMAWLVGI